MCPNLPPLTNGAVDYSAMETEESRPVNTVATYSCNPGYTLSGNTTSTCGSEGLWSLQNNTPAVCQGISFPGLYSIHIKTNLY